MLRKFRRVHKNAWIILVVIVLYVVLSLWLRASSTLEAPFIFYTVQPVFWVLVAASVMFIARGKKDRLRHKTERMFLIACIIAIWFVLYFLSGLYFTYVRNTLVVSVNSVLLNMAAFALVGICIEYVRYHVMLMAKRQNVIWFGSIVTVVFALAQMNIAQLFFVENPEQFVKLLSSDFIPAIVSSSLLTYLAFTCGLGAMMLYKLGVVAITILPPVIPKHDWYLIGVGSVLLALAIYIAIEQTQREHENGRHHYGQVKTAYNVMLTSATVALVLFMTGVFTYRPYAIVSDSMVPVYSRGSMVVVQKVDDPMDISVGDIIQYEATGKMITHRVVAIDAAADGSGKRVFITKGDNVQSRDPLVAESQVRGIIRSQVPYVGYPSVWLREASVGASR